jgi:hypothetical protein
MASRVASRSWLSVTPEPERLLPETLATLRHGRRPPASAVERERADVERLVLHGRERGWLAYMSSAVALIERTAASRDADVVRAREVARDVIANHHNLLLGLPGRGAERTAGERIALERAPGPRLQPDHKTTGHP